MGQNKETNMFSHINGKKNDCIGPVPFDNVCFRRIKTKRKKGVKTEKKYGKKEAIDASKRRQCQRVVVEKIKGI